MKSDSWLRSHAFLSILVVVIFSIAAGFAHDFQFYSIANVEFSKLLSTLASYAVIALLIERAVAVIRNVGVDRNVADTIGQEHGIDPIEILALDRRRQLSNDAALIEADRQYRVGRISAVIALILGLLVSLAGVRLLATFIPDGALMACVAEQPANWDTYLQALKAFLSEQFKDATSAQIEATTQVFAAVCETESIQRMLFSAVDVAITGTILSGGSALVHDIITTIRNQFPPDDKNSPNTVSRKEDKGNVGGDSSTDGRQE